MSDQIAISQDSVLKMLGEREIKIAFLTEQLGAMGREIAKLKAQLEAYNSSAESKGGTQ